MNTVTETSMYDHSILMAAPHAEERQKWVDSIRLAIEYHTYWLDQVLVCDR